MVHLRLWASIDRKKEETMKTVFLLIYTLFMLCIFAVKTHDPVAEAWQCRCDTCCEYLEQIGAGR
jgi:hypothetical protein